MVGWNPTLIVSHGAAGNSWPVSTLYRDLFRRVDLLRTLGACLCAHAVLARNTAALGLLGEESGDPCVVDEVGGTGKGSGQDQIQEDAIGSSAMPSSRCDKKNAHLRVEKAGGRFNDANSRIECLQSVVCALVVADHGGNVKLQVLWVQLSNKAVDHALLLARRNLQVGAGKSKIADDLSSLLSVRKCPERPSDHTNGDRGCFLVGDGQDCLCLAPVD